MTKKYETFQDWFDEIENYGMRSERFYDEYGQYEGRARMIEWLKAAWDCAREEKKEEIWTHWCHVKRETWNTWLDRCTHCGNSRDEC